MISQNVLGLLVLVSVLSFAVGILEETQEDDNESTELSHYFPLSSNWKKAKFVCPTTYGKFAHETDCSMFYECRYGYPHLMKCRRGKLFDDKKEECKDARRVKCKRDRDDKKKDKDSSSSEDSRSKETTSSSSSEEVTNEITFKCPYIWGTFPHPVDCSKYFVCIYKVPTLYECSRKELYDIKSRKCREKRRVKCGDRLDRDQMKTSKRPTTTRHTTPIEPQETTITTEAPTTIETNEFGCPFPYGKYANPNNCSLYYECKSAVPTLHQCPESTLYDERKEECRENYLVRCGERPGGLIEDDSSEEKKEKKEELRCPYTWGQFPHPDDCSKYMICIYNVPTVYSCKKTELFYAKYRRCFPKELVTCDYRINPDDLIQPSRKTTLITETTPISTAPPTTTLESTTTTTETSTTTPTTTTVPTTTTTPTTVPTTTTTPTTVPTTTTTPTTIPTTTTTPTTIPTTTTTPTTIPTTTSTPTTVSTTTTTPTTVPTTTTTPTTVLTTTPTTVPTPTTTTLGTTMITKPNTPPPTDCEEDDLDCIIDDTGDVSGWFDCPARYGHFAHGASHQLFIHCDNWRPFVKRCADDTAFSPKYLVCMWIEKPGQKSGS